MYVGIVHRRNSFNDPLELVRMNLRVDNMKIHQALRNLIINSVIFILICFLIKNDKSLFASSAKVHSSARKGWSNNSYLED